LTRYEKLKARMQRGETIILDGGTSTDIQKRGAPMSGDVWSADANLTHPEIVRAVHDDYIRAGADIIAANTYASSPLMLDAEGRIDDMDRIDGIAMGIALAAAADTDVCVAGSMSIMRPMNSGSDRNDLSVVWTEQEARELFARKAQGLKQLGADLIMMEMMRDLDYSMFASEAALATGLPVWIGLSAERSASGELQGWGRDDSAFENVARGLAALNPDAMCIMHTSINDTDDAVSVLRKHWSGPIAIYPECGYFQSPDWKFIDVIAPSDLVLRSRGWKKDGVHVFGGCCGIGPEHIHALSQEFKR
jgi:S-methylmethionine-dependent homocysteine/selenocysteine methylase